ncbi:MAG TPA: LPXTG cell wall anchor domain-containing protein, partial [Patescibacteria group bacterium]|nr:LPXTG cell wall anchor domain-containing protein [Patescibacteria group bacterium]
YKKKPEPIPEPTPIAEIKGSIDVQYIDEHSNIIKQEIMNDFTLGTYDIVAKEIAGYKLNDISTKTVDLSEQNPIQVVIFQYKTVEVPPTKPESKPEPKPDKEQDADKVEELLQYGTVKGKATDIYGNPIINLRVELHSEPRATFTNEYGEYEFVDVELGEHTITVIDARFQEVSKFEIIVKAMNSAENIVLTNLANAPLTLSEEVRDREVDIIVTPRLVIEDVEGIDEKSIDKDIAETIEVGEQNQDPIIPVKAKEPDVQPQQPEIIDKKLPQTGDSGLLETILLMVFLLLGVWYFFLKKR